MVEKVLRLQHGRRLTVAGRDLLDSIEVEEKKGLNFEDLSVKSVETIEQDIDEEDVNEVAENLENDIEVEENKEDIKDGE